MLFFESVSTTYSTVRNAIYFFSCMTCIFTYNVTLPQVFLKHFASKNQLPALTVSCKLLENGLKFFNA